MRDTNFKAWMLRLYGAFKREYHEGQAHEYWRMLKHLDDSIFGETVYRAIKTCRAFPSIAELTALSREVSEYNSKPTKCVVCERSFPEVDTHLCCDLTFMELDARDAQGYRTYTGQADYRICHGCHVKRIGDFKPNWQELRDAIKPKPLPYNPSEEHDEL